MQQQQQHLRSRGAFLFNSSSSRHLAQHEQKRNPAELPKSFVSPAYGYGNCPKVVRLLADDDQDVVLQALRTLSTMLKLPQEVHMCLNCGVIPYLETLIFNPSTKTRRYAAESLHLLSLDANGRRELLKNQTPSRIIKVLEDQDSSVRKNTYQTIINLSRIAQEAKVVTSSGFIQPVVLRLKNETNEELKPLTLQLLKNCCNDGTEMTVNEAISLGVVDPCIDFLTAEDPDIREAALQAIEILAFTEQGRNLVHEKEAVRTICNLLMDTNWRVCSASAGALKTLCIHDDVKRTIYSSAAMGYVRHLLESPKRSVVLNLMKLITGIATYPPARQSLNKAEIIESLRSYMKDSDQVVARAAQLALQMVVWNP